MRSDRLKWLEVSLTADGEVAEAAADVLARHTPAGLVLEPVGGESELAPGSSIRVRAFLPVDEQLDLQRARIEEGLWHLGQIMPIPAASFREIEEEDWAESWKSALKPVPVGERLLIQPSWLPPVEGNRVVVFIDPGQAFGTGAHPSTRLCLLAIEEHLRPGDTAFDVGCGSGILSIAAARLGAARVRAFDVDPLAITAAKENVERNGVDGVVRVEKGSLAEILAACQSEGSGADILLANILASVLEELIDAGLAEAVRPQGKLVLSGILSDQAQDLWRRAEKAGLGLLQVIKEADWQALVLERKIAPN